MRSIAFRLLFLVVATFAAAQVSQVATGTPPFGSFGGGPFDVVNLGNLNVHFSIPVFSSQVGASISLITFPMTVRCGPLLRHQVQQAGLQTVHGDGRRRHTARPVTSASAVPQRLLPLAIPTAYTAL